MPGKWGRLGLVFIAFFTISASLGVRAASWLDVFNQWTFSNAIPSGDGGFVAVGRTEWIDDAIRGEAVIVRLNASGDVVWVRELGGWCNDDATILARCSDGSYLVAGKTCSWPPDGGPDNLWLIRIASSGDVLWQKTYSFGNYVTPHSVVPVVNPWTGTEEFLLVGTVREIWTSRYHGFVLLVDQSGARIWLNRVGGTSDYVDLGVGCQVTDGSLVAAGTTLVTGRSEEALVLHLDYGGAVLDQTRWGTTAEDRAGSALLPSPDGGFLVGATSRAVGNQQDLYLLKFSSSGSLEWQRSYGHSTNETMSDMFYKPDGHLVVGATAWGLLEPLSYPDLWFFELDAAYDYVWQKKLHFEDVNYLKALVPGADGQLALCVDSGATAPTCAGGILLQTDSQGTTGLPCVEAVAAGGLSAEGMMTSASASYPVTPLTLNPVVSASAVDDFLASMKRCRPGGYTAPPLEANNTAVDIDDCADTGILVTWPADPADWGDGGLGGRHYEILNGASTWVACIPYGTTTMTVDDGLRGPQTPYLIKVRYTNGMGMSSETAGINAADMYSYAPPLACSVTDNDPAADTGVTITWPTPVDWGDYGRSPENRRIRVFRDGQAASGYLTEAAASYLDLLGPNNVEAHYELELTNGCGNVTFGMGSYCTGMDLVPPPGEASAALAMTVQKGAGDTVIVQYDPAACASDHHLYTGYIDADFTDWYLWGGATCNHGCTGTLSADIGPLNPGALYYFVVVGSNGTQEGSYGKDSTGAERPEALYGGSCDAPQVLTGNCQ